MLGGIVLGMAWFTAFVIAHALLFHLRSVRKRFQAILNLFVSAIAAQAISCVIVAAMGAGRIGGVRIAVCALAGTVVMCSVWVLYMPFYYVLLPRRRSGPLSRFSMPRAGSSPWRN